MDFSKALYALKKGHKITNTGWNGKDQYIVKMAGYPDGVPANENFFKATGTPIGTQVKISPYYVLRNAQGEYVPWTPSTGDLNSDKWEVLTVEERPEKEAMVYLVPFQKVLIAEFSDGSCKVFHRFSSN